MIPTEGRTVTVALVVFTDTNETFEILVGFKPSLRSSSRKFFLGAPALLDVHLTPTYPTVLTHIMGPFLPLRFASLGGERPSQTHISGPPFDSDLDAT